MRSLPALACQVCAVCLLACSVMAQDDPRPSSPAEARDSGAKAPLPGKDAPAGTWTAAKADELERLHDAFYAEPDAARRKAIYEQNQLASKDGLTLEDMERTFRNERPEGVVRGDTIRMTCPWMQDNPRGWFMFAAPAGYTPRKSWGLVIILHGSASEGDNLPPFYSPHLGKLGVFALYPTTTVKGRHWGQPEEVANLLREVDWVARRYRIDFRRIALTGGSMGGCGTWSLLMARPDVWHAGAPVAGYPGLEHFDFASLAAIRGIPFYMLHGELDHSDGTRRLAAEFQRRRIDVTYVEAPGSGHTPPDGYWKELCVWLSQQAAKPWSPRPLFIPAAPSRPMWQAYQDPLRLHDDADPALAMIRAGRLAEARQALRAPPSQTTPSLRLHLLRALVNVPGLLDDYPLGLRPKDFAGDRGWTAAAETAALKDLGDALRAKVGEPAAPHMVAAELHLLVAKIWAKRFGCLVDAGGTAWVAPYNSFVNEIRACMASPICPSGALPLLQASQARFPVGFGAAKDRN